MSGTDEVRIGDAEREHVRDLLQQHAADGRLTLEELGDRIAEVYAAKTAEDLAHTLRELPVMPDERTIRTRAAAGPAGSGPGQWRQGPRRGWGFPGLPLLVIGGIWLLVALTTGWFFFPWPLLFLGFFLFRGWGGGWCGPGPRSSRWV
jgi:hypothetical protein